MLVCFSHLAPELVVGQSEQPLQILDDESGIFQKLLHHSGRAVLWRRLVRHKAALLLPLRVLRRSREKKGY